MSRFTKYATTLCGLLLLLEFIAAVGVHEKRYWLDPLHFYERGSTFLCIHEAHDVVILAAVLAAAAGLFFDLLRNRKAKAIKTPVFIVSLVILFWVTGYLLLWFTLGVGFLCGGG